MSAVPWRVAWQHALYDAELGFYVTRGGPAAHFTTAAQGPLGAVLAEALLRLWYRHVPDRPPSVIVDIGAGRGELATHLAELVHPPTSPERSVRGRTQRYTAEFGSEHCVRGQVPVRRQVPVRGEVRVVGVEVVDRPEGLDPRVDWVRSPGGAALPDPSSPPPLTDALVIAHEWLDVVPCPIAEIAADGLLREVLVDPTTGDEQPGPTLTTQDQQWAEEHWPTSTPGDRVEIGRSRDEAWADLISKVDSGLVVAIDYGHVASERPSGGTLAAYRLGHLTRPVPDGTCDLTAHVAMDTLAADELHRQRDLLVGLGLDASPPEHATARTDPTGYLHALERTSAQARLIERGGFGDFWWAVKRLGPPDVA